MKKSVLFLFLLMINCLIQAEAPSFTGLWETTWGPVELLQEGNFVTGNYGGSHPGVIKGVVKEKRLDYQWIGENGDMGLGYFEIGDDGETISGEWGEGESNSNGGLWFGLKKE